MTALANRVLVTLQTVRAPQRNPRVDRHRRVVDFLGQPLDGEANGQQDVKQLRVLWLEDATLAEAQKEGEQVLTPSRSRDLMSSVAKGCKPRFQRPRCSLSWITSRVPSVLTRCESTISMDWSFSCPKRIVVSEGDGSCHRPHPQFRRREFSVEKTDNADLADFNPFNPRNPRLFTWPML